MIGYFSKIQLFVDTRGRVFPENEIDKFVEYLEEKYKRRILVSIDPRDLIIDRSGMTKVGLPITAYMLFLVISKTSGLRSIPAKKYDINLWVNLYNYCLTHFGYYMFCTMSMIDLDLNCILGFIPQGVKHLPVHQVMKHILGLPEIVNNDIKIVDGVLRGSWLELTVKRSSDDAMFAFKYDELTHICEAILLKRQARKFGRLRKIGKTSVFKKKIKQLKTISNVFLQIVNFKQKQETPKKGDTP